MMTTGLGKLGQLLTLVAVLLISPLTIAGPIIAGSEWYQPRDLESLYNWNDFNATCPGGICNGRLRLTGPDLTGWTWASVDDVNTLFNSFIFARDGISPLGPGPSQYINPASIFGQDVLATFQATWEVWSGMVGADSRGVVGWVRDESPNEAGYGLVAEVVRADNSWSQYSYARTDEEYEKSYSYVDGGAWLFRPASQAVPVSPTLTLSLLGLAMLAAMRRKPV